MRDQIQHHEKKKLIKTWLIILRFLLIYFLNKTFRKNIANLIMIFDHCSVHGIRTDLYLFFNFSLICWFLILQSFIPLLFHVLLRTVFWVGTFANVQMSKLSFFILWLNLINFKGEKTVRQLASQALFSTLLTMSYLS